MNDWQKKLNLSGPTYFVGGKYRSLVVDAVARGDLVVLETKNRQYSWREYSISDREVTSTYDQCVELNLDRTGKLSLRIYNGDMLDGQPRDLRVEYVLEGKWWSFPELTDQVEENFLKYCVRKVLENENLERLHKAQAIGQELLAKFQQVGG